MLDFSRSIVQEVELFSHVLPQAMYIKRDDLIHPVCNGNKARKFASLMSSESSLDSEKRQCWVSYGGIQSNAMVALAYLASLRGVKFYYIAPSLDSETMPNTTSRNASCNNLCNLSYALSYGMELITLPQGSFVGTLKTYALSLSQNLDAIFIPQGGRIEWARGGMMALANELREQVSSRAMIFYTSGSGVSAVALKEALDEIMPQTRLVCIACAGRVGELEAQFIHKNLVLPTILYTPFKFAKPYVEVWAMREYLALQGVRVDLIYDSVGFYAIWAALQGEGAKGFCAEFAMELKEEIKKRQLVFIHSGGLSGDVSQEMRYRQKFGERLLDSEMKRRVLAFDEHSFENLAKIMLKNQSLHIKS